MKLYRYFGIKEETDFVNVRLEKDNRLFIDPFLIYKSKNQFDKQCYKNIEEFFTILIEYAKKKDDKNAIKLVKNLYEREETRLGYSLKSYSGKGFSKSGGIKLYNALKENHALQEGLVKDIFDCNIMLTNLGEDKISDLVTSIIFLKLVEFTEEQCSKYQIPTYEVKINKKCWNADKLIWENISCKLPIDKKENPIVFVPKNITSYKQTFTYENVYQEIYIPYYEQIELNSGNKELLIEYKNGKKRINRKELKKKNPCNKIQILEFITQNKELYIEYKKNKLLKE